MIDGLVNTGFMGEGNFVWFHGIVEDIHDPLFVGRVKVRCYGFHSPSKTDIPTESLPWALVMSPTTSASINGIGFTPHGLVQGSQVIGFFRDGSMAQHPVVLGSILSIPGSTSAVDEGFNDPEGIYPKPDFIDESDSNRLGREFEKESFVGITRASNLITGITLADESTWNENEYNNQALYPDNFVIETKSGHVIELDSTPNQERIHVYHKSGSYIEIDSLGNIQQKSLGDTKKISHQSSYEYTGNDYNITCSKNASMFVNNNYSIKLIDGNMTINIDKGDLNLNINGNVKTNISGDVTQVISGNVSETISGNKEEKISGTYKLTASGRVDIKGSTINLN